MISRRDAAINLDIPLEMASKHGLPAKMTDAELADLDENPPAWLIQSRANRTGKPVWIALTCDVCGFTESVRPKKWWPDFTYVTCDFHNIDELPDPAAGTYREEIDAVGSRFVGIHDRPA